MTQAGLFDATRQPAMTDRDVAILIGHLAGRGWRTARDLKSEGFNDRELRALANASKGEVISGQRGYCLLREATIPEAQRAADWLRHQGKEMIRRGNDIEQAMHRRQSAAA